MLQFSPRNLAKQVFIGGIAMCLILMASCAWGQTKGIFYEDLTEDELDRLSMKVPRMPTVDEVVAITMELESDPIGRADTPKLRVPETEFGTILELIGTPELDRNPMLRWSEVASIKIYVKGDVLPMIRIGLYQTWNNPIRFSFNGIRCNRDRASKKTKLDNSLRVQAYLRRLEADLVKASEAGNEGVRAAPGTRPGRERGL